jgi:hypothetical protein
LSQFQSDAHVPLEGPDDVPDAHVCVSAHQPHALASVQSSQPLHVEQGSVPLGPPGQDEGAYAHSLQVPLHGPVVFPSRHCSLSTHQPQPLA